VIKLRRGQYKIVVQVFGSDDRCVRNVEVKEGQWAELNITVDGDVTY